MHLPGKKSKELFERAQRVIPGGVNSPVRAFRGVGGQPLFIERGAGAEIVDVDGRSYIDYVASWGPLILGHADGEAVEALERALKSGTSFGAPTEGEVELAELLSKLVPSLEMVRLVSSGTEATMSAVRLARAFTGRSYIVKCNGCYHGHADTLLVKAGSGVATLGIPGSPGVPDEIAQLTLSIEFNDADALEEVIETRGASNIAAFIVEPVPGNMGLVIPEPGYLERCERICRQHGILLIFDEVMTGMRVALGGAQERFNIRPDLSTFGKVIGGGLPVGAFGGRRDIMSMLAPSGGVYQAGTLSGNPLAVQAGLATLRRLSAIRPYQALEDTARMLMDGFARAASAHAVPLQTSVCGSMFGFFFADAPVRSYADAQRSNVERFRLFFHGMLAEGVYLAPSAFEAGFVSTAHTRDHIQRTLAAADRAFSALGSR